MLECQWLYMIRKYNFVSRLNLWSAAARVTFTHACYLRDLRASAKHKSTKKFGLDSNLIVFYFVTLKFNVDVGSSYQVLSTNFVSKG